MKLLVFVPWCGGIHLYVHVIPVCSVDVPAVSSVVSVLTYYVCDRGACMQAPRSQTQYVSTETTLLTAGTSTDQTGIT